MVKISHPDKLRPFEVRRILHDRYEEINKQLNETLDEYYANRVTIGFTVDLPTTSIHTDALGYRSLRTNIDEEDAALTAIVTSVDADAFAERGDAERARIQTDKLIGRPVRDVLATLAQGDYTYRVELNWWNPLAKPHVSAVLQTAGTEGQLDRAFATYGEQRREAERNAPRGVSHEAWTNAVRTYKHNLYQDNDDVNTRGLNRTEERVALHEAVKEFNSTGTITDDNRVFDTSEPTAPSLY